MLASLAGNALADAGPQTRPLAVDAVRILKRRRHWPEVEAVLHVALAAGAGRWAHREAAILYEHRLPRLDEALRHARLAGEPGREERLRRRSARGN